MEIKEIKLSQLLNNEGQIEGLPKNPRFCKDERFAKLVKSIQDDPEMLELRECIVYPFQDKYIVIGGNMRLRACRELKFKTVPCKILPVETPVEKLRAYTVKDNVAIGSNDYDMFANEWDAVELEDWGVELPEISNDEQRDLSNDLKETFEIIISAPNEKEQEIIYNRLIGEGYICRVLTL
jgi:hypothetical protein